MVNERKLKAIKFVTSINSLSFEARGVMILIDMMPEDFSITKQWVIKQSGAGRDRVGRILNELINSGLLSENVERNSSGQLSGVEYVSNLASIGAYNER